MHSAHPIIDEMRNGCQSFREGVTELEDAHRNHNQSGEFARVDRKKNERKSLAERSPNRNGGNTIYINPTAANNQVVF